MHDTTPHPLDRDLLFFVDDEIEPARRAPIESHLAECAACRLRRARLEDTTRAVSQALAQGDANPPSAARTRASLRSRMKHTGRERRWTPWAAAAAVAALAVLAVTIGMGPRRVAHSDREIVSAEVEAGALPLSHLTPGAVRAATPDELCSVRPFPLQPPVPPAVRAAVLRDYGLEHLSDHEYELDYLITPALGGIGERTNLWPETYAPRVWNAYVKDDLEGLLSDLVCARRIPLSTAQQDMASNWIAAYKKYFRTDRPRQPFTSARASAFVAQDPIFEFRSRIRLSDN